MKHHLVPCCLASCMERVFFEFNFSYALLVFTCLHQLWVLQACYLQAFCPLVFGFIGRHISAVSRVDHRLHPFFFLTVTTQQNALCVGLHRFAALVGGLCSCLLQSGVMFGLRWGISWVCSSSFPTLWYLLGLR